MKVPFRHFWLPWLVAILAIPSCRPPHVGQRLLHIDIEQDGKLVLSGIQGVPDDTPVQRMWDILDDVQFEASSDAAPLATAGTSASATLDGRIVVRIRHVHDVLAETTLTKLRLDRLDAPPGWKLAGGEGARIRKQLNAR